MLNFFALALLLGATIPLFLSVLPSMQWVTIAFAGSLIGMTGLFWRATHFWGRQWMIVLLSVILGMSWVFIQFHQRLVWTLPMEDENKIIEIVGKVVGLTQESAHPIDKTLRFEMVIQEYKGVKLTKPIPKIRLFWHNATQPLAEGDYLRCTVKLKLPWRLANPGGFDQEKQFLIENVRAIGKVIQFKERVPNTAFSFNQWRQTLNQALAQKLEDKPFLGIIQAMTLGINTNITASQWKIFQATGTTHIISISGAHIGLIAMLCLHWVAKITSRSFYLTTCYPAKEIGAVVGIASAFLYSALAGFSVPTQRACIMILVSMLAIFKRQPIFTWHTLALSWIGVFIIDPLAPLQMGFWLSFGCVALLIYGKPHYVGVSRLAQWWMPQWVIFVGLFPLCLYFFQQVPLLSPLANLLALPIVSFIVVPASLLGLLFIKFIPVLAGVCLEVAHSGLALLWIILEPMAHAPFAVWECGRMPLSYLLLALLGVFLILAPLGFPCRILGWVGWLPMLFYSPTLLKEGEYRLTLLDVGQGLAAVIETKHHTLLYDTGPQYHENQNAGSSVIKPFLMEKRIYSIDKIVVSHGDLDHSGGLKGLSDLHIGEIITSEPERLAYSAIRCHRGMHWEWDGIQFTILGPQYSTQKHNNLSCVLKVSNGYHTVLFTGDIEEKGEKQLLHAEDAFELKSDILVVPHHGSLTSSSIAFIEAVQPTYALYAVGRGNPHGFPKKAILARYEERGIQNLIVSQTGALSFHLKLQDSLDSPTYYRAQKKRYWHVQNALFAIQS